MRLRCETKRQYLNRKKAAAKAALSEDIAAEAHRVVFGDRGADYGDPRDNLTRTGRMWGAILGIPDVTPEQVGMCMVAAKLSRQCHKPKRDNLVDSIGYLLCVDRIVEQPTKTP